MDPPLPGMARDDERAPLPDVVTHALALDRLQTGATVARIAGEDEDDVRRTIWSGLRGALERLEAADPDAFAHVHAEVRELNLGRIARISEEIASGPGRPHDDLDRALRDGATAPHPRAPLEEALLRAHAIDHLRVLNAEGVISGGLGWAARRWAWADLHDAVLRLERDERATHDHLAGAADELLATADGRPAPPRRRPPGRRSRWALGGGWRRSGVRGR